MAGRRGGGLAGRCRWPQRLQLETRKLRRRRHSLDGPSSALENLLRSSTRGISPSNCHWPIYPALLIWLLWNFAPGAATPLQYYLQNVLQARDTQWGQWNAIYGASFIPTFVLFGVLCRRFPLRTLLVWGTVAAIPQFVPLLFIQSIPLISNFF